MGLRSNATAKWWFLDVPYSLKEGRMAVTIYTTPSCSYCTMAKGWFKENGIRYTEYNVAQDTRRADEMMRKSGQMGVPVLDVNGRVIVGFKKSEIEQALRR
jgi:glutaredoxin 3